MNVEEIKKIAQERAEKENRDTKSLEAAAEKAVKKARLLFEHVDTITKEMKKYIVFNDTLFSKNHGTYIYRINFAEHTIILSLKAGKVRYVQNAEQARICIELEKGSSVQEAESVVEGLAAAVGEMEEDFDQFAAKAMRERDLKHSDWQAVEITVSADKTSRAKQKRMADGYSVRKGAAADNMYTIDHVMPEDILDIFRSTTDRK